MGRMRSPNFPILPLEEAINVAKAIWDKNRKAPIAREAAAKDVGYTGLTGRSMQVLGSLNQYGLVEITAKGLTRVTQLAENILIGFPEDVKQSAIAEAGRTPPLFREIYDKFDGHIPGENAIRSFLLQRGFTNEGVEKALKSFNSTNRFVEMHGVSESYGNEVEAASESPPEPSHQENRPVENLATIQPSDPLANAIRGRVPLDFQLSMNGLEVSGRTKSRSELERFISTLNTILPLIPEDQDGKEN